MPHLEDLMLTIGGRVLIDPLLDSIERGSPLVKSLRFFCNFPDGLAQRGRLLNRLVYLEMTLPPDDNMSFFRGLQNLEELV